MERPAIPGSGQDGHASNGRRLAILAVSAILLVMSGFPGWAQGRHAGASASPAGIRIPDGMDAIRLPLVTSNGHIILPVSVNGSEPLPVVLDTGMPVPGLTLFENEETRSIPLKFGDARVRIGGAGGDGHHLEARMAEGVELAIGDVKIPGCRVIALPPVHGFPGDHSGVIGAEILDRFTVEVNQDRKELVLWRPGAYRPSPGAAVLPLEMKNHLPFVTATLAGPNGLETPLSLVLDLGATHNVSLNVTSNDAIRLPPGAIESNIGRGLSGDLFGHVGRIPGFSLGAMTLDNVVATFPDAKHENPRGVDGRNGNLGMGVLGRFNMVIDYAASKMYLEASKRFDDPFEWDMSGMTLFPGDGDGLVVNGIIAGSPAESAGLKKGDTVTAVNGKPVSQIGFSRVKEIFREDGAVINVTFQREGATDSVSLQLRRLV